MSVYPIDAAGDGPPRIVLLHGLDGIAAVWGPLLAALGPDADVRAPDLAGHGSAPTLGRYGYDDLAGELLARLGDELVGRELVLVGHSLGGVVALLLAARPELSVRAVVAIGCKTVWPDADLAAMARVADKGVAGFGGQAEAVERFLRVSGLTGLLDPAAAAGGVRHEDGRWRLAVDPEVHRVAAVDFAALLDGVRAPVVLAAGEHDAMAPPDDLARFGRPVEVIAGAGHNVHVERPDAVAALLAPFLATRR